MSKVNVRARKPVQSVKRTDYSDRKIVVLSREHGARKGTKRAKAMEKLLHSRNTAQAIPYLHKIGADNSFIKYAVRSKLIKLAA